MEPGHMLERVGPETLVIVPGDREDVILTLTTAHLMGTPRTAWSMSSPDRPSASTTATPVPRSGSS